MTLVYKGEVCKFEFRDTPKLVVTSYICNKYDTSECCNSSRYLCYGWILDNINITYISKSPISNDFACFDFKPRSGLM